MAKLSQTKMSTKIYFVLGVLIVVAAAVSAVGIMGLSGMNDRLNDIVEVSAEKVKLGARIQQDMLAIGRAEKNLILARTTEEMDEYAGFIAQTREEMRARREELRELVDAAGKARLDEFAGVWDQYLEVDDQVRDLSRLNSNVKARKLSANQGREAYEAAAAVMKEVAAINEAELARAVGADAKLAADKALGAARAIQDMLEIHRAEKNLILQTSQEGMDSYAQAIEQRKKELDARLAELEAAASPEGRAKLQEFKPLWAGFLKINEQVRDTSRENGNSKAYELSTGQGRELADKSEELLTAIVAKNLADMDADKKASDANYQEASLTMMLVSGIGLALGLALGLFIVIGVNRTLRRVAQELNSGADQVAAASGQVSSSGQTLAEGASEQASSLEETSASLEEITSMTKQNAANAGQADSLMKESIHVVEQANSSMKDLRQAMDKITSASEETGKIIKTIDEIAFQTNLLALNAAVEAARAGEAGAGFAVVADEVRNLAMRAAEAAKNTQELIEGNITNIRQGSELVVTTDDNFSRVEESSHKVGELVGEIAAASNEQAQGVEQINSAMGEMDKVVQSVASNAEESAAAAEELDAQAITMRGSVTNLLALVNGGSGGNGGRDGAAHRTPRKLLAHEPKHQEQGGGKATQAKAAPAKTAKPADPQKEIPLEDGDFADF